MHQLDKHAILKRYIYYILDVFIWLIDTHDDVIIMQDAYAIHYKDTELYEGQSVWGYKHNNYI